MHQNNENPIVAAKRYMDVGEVAGYLGISKWLVYKHIERREIPFIPFGRLIRFDRMAVDRCAEKRTVQAAPRRRARPEVLEPNGPLIRIYGWAH